MRNAAWLDLGEVLLQSLSNFTILTVREFVTKFV
jgi:hypothetical protein